MVNKFTWNNVVIIILVNTDLIGIETVSSGKKKYIFDMLCMLQRKLNAKTFMGLKLLQLCTFWIALRIIYSVVCVLVVFLHSIKVKRMKIWLKQLLLCLLHGHHACYIDNIRLYIWPNHQTINFGKYTLNSSTELQFYNISQCLRNYIPAINTYNKTIITYLSHGLDVSMLVTWASDNIGQIYNQLWIHCRLQAAL